MRLQLADNLLPVQAFFNAIWSTLFVEIIDEISQRQSQTINECGVFFPEDADKDEESYSGAKFFVNDEEVIISNQEFILYTKMACDAHLQRHPEDKDRIAEILECAKRNFPA